MIGISYELQYRYLIDGILGKVFGEPMDIPGVGKFIAFEDTEGNRLSMLQPVPKNGK